MPTYPLHFNSIDLEGPTLIYIDENGVPVLLELTDEDAQSVIDKRNSVVRQLMGKECTCHKFIRLHDGNCDVHGFVRKQEVAECGA